MFTSAMRTWPWASRSTSSKLSKSCGSMLSTTPSAITATPSRRPYASRLMIAQTSVSTSVLSRIGWAVNSSGMSVSVAPAALPMPSARCPALRPIAMMKYQRDVVLASTMMFFTISTPTWRAVWKPNVST